LKVDRSFEKEGGSWEMEGKGSGDHRLERRVEDLSMWWLVERDWGTTVWLAEKHGDVARGEQRVRERLGILGFQRLSMRGDERDWGWDED